MKLGSANLKRPWTSFSLCQQN